MSAELHNTTIPLDIANTISKSKENSLGFTKFPISSRRLDLLNKHIDKLLKAWKKKKKSNISSKIEKYFHLIWTMIPKFDTFKL